MCQAGPSTLGFREGCREGQRKSACWRDRKMEFENWTHVFMLILFLKWSNEFGKELYPSLQKNK